MSLLDFLLGRSDFIVEPPELQVRSMPELGRRDLPASLRRPATLTTRAWDMANADRLASAWSTSTTSADGEVRYQLANIRARARTLEQNDPFVGKFLHAIEANVVGEHGIQPVPMPRDRRNRGRLDPTAQRAIADEFREWSKAPNCTVCGLYSLAEVQERLLRSVAVDGELFVRLVTGPRAGNRWGFALQLLEGDLVPETFSENRPGGNVVRMGVEMNDLRRPVAYWFYRQQPGDIMFVPGEYGPQEKFRVDAEGVIHCALRSRMRPGQTRAVSWLAPVGTPIYQLNQYRGAEVVAAREAAEVVGTFKPPAGEDGFSGDHFDVDEHAYLENIQAGEKRILPPDWDYELHNVTRPNTAFGDFVSSMIRTISSGFGLSYEVVASDLTRASYSSGRIGALEDRKTYRKLQNWTIRTLLDPIYPRWLEAAALSGAFRLSVVDFDRLAPVRWQTEGWAWVDPQKEASGNQTALENGSRLIGDIVAESTGRTLEEHVELLAAEVELYDEHDLKHPSAKPPPPVAPPAATEGDPQSSAPGEQGEAEDGDAEEGDS